jgi:3-phosphoshikimate 1-carboxyvinyltransferase
LTTLVVHPAERPLAGSVPVPCDPSIAQRALVLAALCRGKTRISGLSPGGAEGVATARCLRAVGAVIEEPSPSERVVTGVGLRGLVAPEIDLDCGSSGTTMRLLSGLLGAQPFRSTLTGSGLLSQPSPMPRPLVAALRARGAVLQGRRDPAHEGELVPPIVVGPLPEGRNLAALQHESAVANDDIKSALLLSGLYADGVTIFREPIVSRDHTERMLDALGVPIRTVGTIVMLDPAGWDGQLPAFELVVPGDLSAAAYLIVAAQLVQGSRLGVRGVGVNPTRSGLLEIARDMGAGLRVEPQGERHGEPVAVVHAWSSPLRAAMIGGERVSRTGDDLPIACALAARADGTTRVHAGGPGPSGREDDRHEDPARLATTGAMLRAFGVVCNESPDGIDIQGRLTPLEPADIDSGGDPRIAMTAAVLALVARAPSRVRNAGSIASAYPKFVATLRALGARVDLEA